MAGYTDRYYDFQGYKLPKVGEILYTMRDKHVPKEYRKESRQETGAWKVVALRPVTDPDRRGQYLVTCVRPTIPVCLYWDVKVWLDNKIHTLKWYWRH